MMKGTMTVSWLDGLKVRNKLVTIPQALKF